MPATMSQRLMRLLLLTLLSRLVCSTKPDRDGLCQRWAEAEECDKNPGYMLSNCATSCELMAKALKDEEALQSIDSFFDLKANDIHGNQIDFKKFEGQVTIVVNVASECGYTDSHYRGLVRLWKAVQPTERVNILAFPCNQFGDQEPGSGEEIYDFARETYGVEFTMMEKVDVNGRFASIVYKFLKSKAGPASIEWNFATYYVISPDGTVESDSGVQPLDLQEKVLNLVQSDEL